MRLNIKKILMRCSVVLFMALPLLLNSTVMALSNAQRKALDGGALYANTEDRCVGASSALSSSTKLTSGKVYILGDSITNSAKSKYIEVFQQQGLTATVNASDSRSITTQGNDGKSGLEAIEADKAIIADPNVKAIVVALGSNGHNSADNVHKVFAALRSLNPARIYWVDTIAIGRPDYQKETIKESNVGIYTEVDANNITAIPWFNTVDPASDKLNPNGNEKDLNGYIVDADVHVHLTAVGVDALVELVSNTVINNASSSSQTVLTGGCSCSVEVATGLNGNDNPEKAWNFFIGKGLSANATAAILGGMWGESGINPHNMQNTAKFPEDVPEMPTEIDANTGQVVPVSWLYGHAGYGILQWTTKDRQLGLIATAKRLGKSTGDLEVQLERVWEELVYKNKVLARLREPDVTINDASDKITMEFIVPGAVIKDRPGYTEEKKDKKLGERRAFSQKMFDDHSGLSPGLALAGSTGSCANITGPGEDTKYVDGFTVYSQRDAAWKNNAYGSSTIEDSGCGPAAMAMIITNLTGTAVSPAETTAYANLKNMYIENVGSSWSVAPVLAEHWGLKSQALNEKNAVTVSSVTAALQAGALVFGFGGGAKPFSAEGHAIIIRGVTSSGKFKVADSWYTDTAEQEWGPEQILSQMSAGSMYAITK